jgi:hypothetical protein
MGLFPGKAPRDFFNQVITNQIARKFPNAGRSRSSGETFKTLFSKFKKHLVVTGTNLSTGRTQLFSRTETPDFPVADAVRISMSLPYAFKPYVIKGPARDNWPEPGVYVDGGLWNNSPLREFEREERLGAMLKVSSTFPDPLAIKNTLLLRLGVNEPKSIDNFGSMLIALLGGGFLGTGESQVLKRFEDRTLVLDTNPLGLLDFAPPTDVRKSINERSYKAVEHYFK